MCSTILGQRLDDDSRMFFWVLGFASIIVIFGSANAACDLNDITGHSIDADCFESLNATGSQIECQRAARVGTIVRTQCQPGYERHGEQLVQCRADGHWYPELKECKRICGKKVSSDTRTNPWHVPIYYAGPANEYYHWCAATIINASTVVTAMQCFWDFAQGRPYNLTEFVAVFGKRHPAFSEFDADSQYFRIDRVHYPRAFRPTGATYEASFFEHDFAVVTLQGMIRFSDRITPICLPSAEEASLPQDAAVRVAGFDFNGNAKSFSLQTISAEACMGLLSNASELARRGKQCAEFASERGHCDLQVGLGLIDARGDDEAKTHFLVGVATRMPRDAVFQHCTNASVFAFTSIHSYLSLFANASASGLQEFEVVLNPGKESPNADDGCRIENKNNMRSFSKDNKRLRTGEVIPNFTYVAHKCRGSGLNLKYRNFCDGGKFRNDFPDCSDDQ